MIIANSSPLIALGRIQILDVIKNLFGKIYIPDAVYQETVLETAIDIQRESILKAIDESTIAIIEPKIDYPFKRKLDLGEKGVLNLALENNPDRIIIDEKRARKEAKELGFETSLVYTTDILKGAEKRGLIDSYSDVIDQLKKLKIYLPE